MDSFFFSIFNHETDFDETYDTCNLYEWISPNMGLTDSGKNTEIRIVVDNK